MALKYKSKKDKHTNILYTIVTALLLCAVFLFVVRYFYESADREAYEQLHLQTKQIKDDLQLQIRSDRENLQTMANFASKLYSDGEDYHVMLESFKPIGLIENIGILNPDNTFVTKAGKLDLSGLIDFDDEAGRGAYISGRIKDLTKSDFEIVRCAVPIKSQNATVGILYGVIKLDLIGEKYGKIAEELNAQLFVYDKHTGNFIIDSVRDDLSNIAELKNRKYVDSYSYEEMMNAEKGYTSFISAYSGEKLYVHYSPLEELGWQIMLARPESLVFAKTHKISAMLILSFAILVAVIVVYILVLMGNEKKRNSITEYTSETRRLLLEINQQHGNISEALKIIQVFSRSRSAVFFDSDGEDYKCFAHEYAHITLKGEDRQYLIGELLRYAAELHKTNNSTLNIMRIIPNRHLVKTNNALYTFFKEHYIKEVSFATVIDKNNYICILGVVNPKDSRKARELLENIAVCFSIAIYNKRHLNKTEAAAITDSLTGVSNRVKYNRDILIFDRNRPENFSCIYIDVNELHMHNNKYGHAAGDEMLMYIANTLKDVFYGHYIYRMGGDEFLVFAEGLSHEKIKELINTFVEQLKPANYNVAIGLSYRSNNINTEEMVREAEVRMYEAKASYYQNKEQQSVARTKDKDYIQIKTGIPEIDSMIRVLKDHYNGIYKVNLDTDSARRILMPAYLGYNENEEHFSKLLNKYIDETVDSEFHRALASFMNYDALKKQFLEGKTPRITYKKTNSETVILSVYKLSETDDDVSNTLWVFAKD